MTNKEEIHFMYQFFFVQLLHSKYLSTREQLDVKCKQTELLDASNFDLEQELAIQRRENDKNRQQIKEFVNVNYSKC